MLCELERGLGGGCPQPLQAALVHASQGGAPVWACNSGFCGSHFQGCEWLLAEPCTKFSGVPWTFNASHATFSATAARQARATSHPCCTLTRSTAASWPSAPIQTARTAWSCPRKPSATSCLTAPALTPRSSRWCRTMQGFSFTAVSACAHQTYLILSGAGIGQCHRSIACRR